MRRLLIASASAFAIFAGIPVAAQNVSNVDQTGNDADATVLQTGNGNNSDVNQDANHANAEVTQRGGPNMSTINQNSGADGAAGGPSANAVIQQISSPTGGALNTATITQNAISSAFSNQIGNGNTATITQDGESLAPQELPSSFAAFVEQIGLNNTATISQPGAENTATSRQYGNDGNSIIAQDGVAGTPFVNNVARVSQEAGSDNAFSSVIQNGQDNTADVLQFGANNESWVTQNGSSHVADVKQYSSDNDSTVIQSGTGNTAAVNQGAPGS